MADWFRHTPKHQNRSNPGGKQHAKPGNIGILWPLAIFTEPDPAESSQCDEDQEDQECGDSKDVEPSHVRKQPV